MIKKCIIPAAGYGTRLLPATKAIPKIIEKPKNNEIDSNLAIIGRYMFTQDIFSYIDENRFSKGEEINITDALMQKTKNNILLAYKFKGTRFECGHAEGYIEAINFCYKHIYKNKKI